MEEEKKMLLEQNSTQGSKLHRYVGVHTQLQDSDLVLVLKFNNLLQKMMKI